MQPGGGGRPAAVQVSHGQPVQLVGALLAHAYLSPSLICPCLHKFFISSHMMVNKVCGVDLAVIHETCWVEAQEKVMCNKAKLMEFF